MKNVVKNLVLASAIAVSGSAIAEFGDISPYVGVDYQQSWMKMKAPFANAAKKTFPGANLYVGAKFHENFGVEAGYNWSTRVKKSFTIASGTAIGTQGNTTVDTTGGTSKVRRSGAFLDLVGFLPVADCFELLGSLGLGWVKPSISVTGATNATDANVATIYNSLAAKAKTVLRLGVGASYMVSDMVGLRVKLGYEGTSALRLKSNTSLTAAGVSTKGFKNSMTASAGVFVKF